MCTSVHMHFCACVFMTETSSCPNAHTRPSSTVKLTHNRCRPQIRRQCPKVSHLHHHIHIHLRINVDVVPPFTCVQSLRSLLLVYYAVI